MALPCNFDVIAYRCSWISLGEAFGTFSYRDPKFFEDSIMAYFNPDLSYDRVEIG